MLIIAGTVPDSQFPLVRGKAKFDGSHLLVAGRSIPVLRGTPALIAASLRMAEVLDAEAPEVILAGDTGKGDGSRLVYEEIVRSAADFQALTLTFHYLQPDVDWHNRILMALDALPAPPLRIADAGFMYAAKMSGYAASYDLFTPDVGELAFLADEKAPHPFYTRGFILHEDQNADALIERAFQHENSAKNLLVKGSKDRFAKDGKILWELDFPSVEAMEAMGGTGDTLTGMASQLAASGLNLEKACFAAALANRYTGLLAKATPATQVADLVAQIPLAWKTIQDKLPPGEGWAKEKNS
ncbi:sugar kinase [Desulfococcaceae bacterium OttesenSCG-928-F15]|nr:sugar kinase [Desulfococcaceae bacterium OttesenSCG-928-F15]